MYEQGDGVPRDPEKAATLWKRYAAEVQRACEHDSHPGLLGDRGRITALIPPPVRQPVVSSPFAVPPDPAAVPSPLAAVCFTSACHFQRR